MNFRLDGWPLHSAIIPKWLKAKANRASAVTARRFIIRPSENRNFTHASDSIAIARITLRLLPHVQTRRAFAKLTLAINRA